MINTQDVFQKIDAEVTDIFTLLTADIKTAIRENSMYKLIEDVLALEAKEKLELTFLNGYQIESLVSRKSNEAWKIRFDRMPENNLFSKEGFEFQESHVRVDKYFANDGTIKAKKGLSASHYTERYVHPITRDKIIVHSILQFFIIDTA